jgi:very-short-patch-repair endonuclease
MGGFRAIADPDRVIAAIASRQHGVVSLHQLLAAGISQRMVEIRVQAGRLHRIHHGVYAVGHGALSNEGRWMAAVLAAGEGAVLSHRSAAELWSLLRPEAGPSHVTVPCGGGRRRRSGLIVHRSSSLRRRHVSRQASIPVTTPARTIADLRRVAEPHEVRRAIRQAEYLGLPLEETATDRTRSDLERAFLRLCSRHRLPSPEVNVRIGPYTADFLWRDARLVVEVDGWQAHRGRQAFLDDRARDAYLKLKGFDVHRFSDEQVEGHEQTLAVLLHRRLASAVHGAKPTA